MVTVLADIGQITGIYQFMNTAWGWPVVESLHFMGLCLLLGTVGVFDLRMLGLGNGIAYADMHRLVPFGIAGFALNVGTGTLFLLSAPDQYIFNPAFQTKLLLMTLAGLNMLWFYRRYAGRVRQRPAFASLPGQARLIALISLSCWLGVIVCGRLITFFRPPYHWCWGC